MKKTSMLLMCEVLRRLLLTCETDIAVFVAKSFLHLDLGESLDTLRLRSELLLRSLR